MGMRYEEFQRGGRDDSELREWSDVYRHTGIGGEGATYGHAMAIANKEGWASVWGKDRGEGGRLLPPPRTRPPIPFTQTVSSDPSIGDAVEVRLSRSPN